MKITKTDDVRRMVHLMNCLESVDEAFAKGRNMVHRTPIIRKVRMMLAWMLDQTGQHKATQIAALLGVGSHSTVWTYRKQVKTQGPADRPVAEQLLRLYHTGAYHARLPYGQFQEAFREVYGELR